MKKINYDELLTELQEFIRDEKVKTELIVFMCKHLEKYDGLKITKRIANEITKQLKNANIQFVCMYNTKYGMYHLDIYKIKESGYVDYSEHIISSLIGHQGFNDLFDFENWIKSNIGFLIGDGGVERLENKINELPELVRRWNALLSDLENVSKDAGNHYPLSKHFDIN